MKKPRTQEDSEIKGDIAKVLKKALSKRGIRHEVAAQFLHVELGTLYKYLAGDMIPGGHVLWRACQHLDLILDKNGLRLAHSRNKPSANADGADQYELPFINESVAGDKVQIGRAHV